ncbi:MAG: prenyltransferase [Dehalococcoidales bacterium]|nr:prenyltransferase [Dehalococcoidales bacterium]
MRLKIWILETRPQFLILSIVLAFLGSSIAWYYGYFNWGIALLAGFGLLLTHISVNTLNDYFDYRSGIDLKTKRTPFSGGSGILPAGMLKPRQALWLGVVTLVIAAAIGIYFIYTSGWQLLPLLVVAGLCVVLYTPLILRLKSPEWAAGLGLGFLPVLGMYFVQSSAYSIPVIIASIPSGILVHNLLFLNEFPDVEADKTAKRQTTPITAGLKTAGKVYIALTIIMYFWIIAAVVARQMPVFTLIGLLTVPIAVKAIRAALTPEDMSKLVPGMANNVMVILITQFLIGAGYILSKVFMV